MRLDGSPRRRYRRPRGRPVFLTLTLCVDQQARPVGAQDARSGAFAFQLAPAARFSGVHPDILEALALERPQWRADRLLELGAEVSDLLPRYEAGGGGGPASPGVTPAACPCRRCRGDAVNQAPRRRGASTGQRQHSRFSAEAKAIAQPAAAPRGAHCRRGDRRVG